MKRPPMHKLPDLPKSEYWELIYDLGTELEETSARLKDNTDLLETALELFGHIIPSNVTTSS